MKVRVEDIGACKKRLHIELESAEVKSELENTYQELSGSAQLPGFRKGHVPRKLIEMKFGKTVNEEVKNKLMDSFFEQASKENKLETMLSPEFENIEYKEGESLTFEAVVDVRPSFELPEYKKLALSRKKAEITKEEIDKTNENLLRSMARFEKVEDRAVKEKDYILGDAEIFEGETSVWKREHISFLLEGTSFAGLEAPYLLKDLQDAKVGDTRDITANIPDTFALETLRGKTAKIKFKVTEIRKMILPELNDEFVQKLGLKDIEELNKITEDRLTSEKSAHVQKDLENQALDKLIEASNIELSDKLIDMQSQVLFQRSVYNLAQMGMTNAQFEEKRELLNEESRKAAVRDLKLSFILEKIADAERLFVTEQEYAQRINEMASQQGIRPQALHLRIEKEGSEKDIRYQMREEKVLKFMLDNAEITDSDKPIDEHEKELAENRRKARIETEKQLQAKK